MKLEKIESTINRIVKEKTESAKKDYDAVYNVVGALIFGDYARGNATPESDFDFVSITRDENDAYVCDFIDTLIEALDAPSGICSITGDYICYKSEKLAKRVFEKGNIIQGNYRIVTPYDDVRKSMEEALSTYKK